MNRETAEKLMQITSESYQKIASSFSETRNFSWMEIDLAIAKYLKNNIKILDLGCGNGRLLISLKKYLENFDYLGLDNCQKLIEKALETQKTHVIEGDTSTCRLHDKNINFIHQNILDLKNFSDSSFDCIFMIASFNHIAGIELREKLLLEVQRILKPEGILIMTNWNLWQLGAKKSFWYNFLKSHFTDYELQITDYKEILTLWQNQFPLYYHAFTLGELKKLLQKSDFKILENYYVKNGHKAHWWDGNNILTIVRKI